MAFVPEGQHDRSQARSAWTAVWTFSCAYSKRPKDERKTAQGFSPGKVRRLALPKQDRIMLPAGLDILGRPKGENRIAHGLQPWEDGPERNRPERAAEGRSLFPKITFVESDSMAFQKLTKLFLIRKFAVMLGLIGNVGGNGLYARLAD
jgi:hypothetical protein